MLLNYIWIGFFVIGFIVAIIQVCMGDTEVFARMVDSLFGSAQTGFEISLGLAGVLTLWQGLLKVGERSGLVGRVARRTSGFFSVLFPSIPKGHPVTGMMLMNFSANMLGLDNAATPLGLQTMTELQTLNKDKERASDAMIMFLCINASGLTLIPLTIIMYRLQLGSTNASDIFLPILLATGASTLTSILLVSAHQRINLLRRAFIIPITVLFILVGLGFWSAGTLSQEELTQYSTLTSHIILIAMVVLLVGSGMLARQNVYENFIEGAKDGFETAVKIIPYIVAILVAVGFFRASGAMDYLMQGLSFIFSSIGIDTRWVEGLPTMLMKPLSGSGARGLMIDAMKADGPDSFVGRLVCLVQGASDTTFYILALYYGSVAIRRTRYTLGICLISDLVGMICSTLLCYYFYA